MTGSSRRMPRRDWRFVVLKTVIAQDEAGNRSMAAWAIHETRMVVGGAPRPRRDGWTVELEGKGLDRSLQDYLALERSGRDIAAATACSCPVGQYHLPRLAKRSGRRSTNTHAPTRGRVGRAAALARDRLFPNARG